MSGKAKLVSVRDARRERRTSAEIAVVTAALEAHKHANVDGCPVRICVMEVSRCLYYYGAARAHRQHHNRRMSGSLAAAITPLESGSQK